MTRWEYRLISLEFPDARPDLPGAVQDVTAQLNALGAMEWEAVGEVHVNILARSGYTRVAQLLMKRAAPGQD